MDSTVGRSGAPVESAVGPAVAAVIFDLDGVLVDTQIWWRDVRDAWAAGHGITWRDEDEHRTMGANTRQWARMMAERAGLDAGHDAAIARTILDALVERYRLEGAPRIPGAVEAVRKIAGRYPVAVASGSHRRLIEVALESIGLDEVVRTIVSADDVPHGKPAPDVYREAARRLGVEPAACLVVEDSLNGLQAAQAAGMAAVLVPNAKVPPDPRAAGLADVVLDRLEELDPAMIGSPMRPLPRRSRGISS